VSGSLGLSIGVANLVAACAGGTPLTRSSVFTLFQHRAAEVGDPQSGSTDSGQVLRGFVERVGHSSPLVAVDGTTHSAETLTAEALDAMARAIGYGAPVTVAVPAYWSADQVSLLRDGLFAQPGLTPPGGVPPVTIPDATAALAALHSEPGFPTDGIVTLCDFGASGTSVTLTDAASNFQQIGPTVRYSEFSGNGIDQLILRNLHTGDNVAEDTDRAGTKPMGSLSRRFDECRRAKEQLSAATVTVVPAEMPGFGQDVRLSRGEFEDMISEPLEQFVSAIEDILERNGIPGANLAAAATVGGGACIPLITSRLSARLDVPIFTTPQPAFSAAIGAAELGRQRSSPGVPTAQGPVLEAPTDLAPAGWAIQAASEAAGESAADEDPSATYRALAWSQDADADADPIPYVGDDAGYEDAAPIPYVAARRRWYTRPGFVVGVTAATAVALVGIVVAAVFALTSVKSPTGTPTSVTSPVESSAVPQESELPSSTIPSPSPSAAPPSPTTVTTVTTVTNAPTTTVWETTRPPLSTTTRSTPTRPTTTTPSTTAQTTTAYPTTTPTWPLTTSPPWGY
jgi:hypothetical protein